MIFEACFEKTGGGGGGGGEGSCKEKRKKIPAF